MLSERPNLKNFMIFKLSYCDLTFSITYFSTILFLLIPTFELYVEFYIFGRCFWKLYIFGCNDEMGVGNMTYKIL